MPSHEPGGSTSHRSIDREVEAAWAAAAAWLEAIDLAIECSPGLKSLLIPHPEPGRSAIDTGLVDADQVHVVVSAVERAGQEVDGLYVGLVAQEPSSRWVGLAGIFIPLCTLCDRTGVGRAIDRVVNLLDKHGFTELTSANVHPGMAPRPGWFGGRLQVVARRTATSSRSAWRAWPPEPGSDVGAAVLVRVAPVISGLSGVIVCASTTEALALPALIGESPRAWTWSAGPHEQVLRAVQHQPRTPRQFFPRGAHDHLGWWVTDTPAEQDPRKLHRGRPKVQAQRTGRFHQARYWALSGTGCATYEELTELQITPASRP